MEPDRKPQDVLEVLFTAAVVLVGGSFAIVVLMVVGGLVLQQFHAPVTNASLARSVAVEAESAFLDSELNACSQRENGNWVCDVGDQGGSGSYIYDVSIDRNSSCWDAALQADGGETPGEERLSGCVNHFEGGWWGLLFG